jgi:hypothetical protein
MKTKEFTLFIRLTVAHCSHAQEQYNFEAVKPAVIEFFKRGAGNPEVAMCSRAACKNFEDKQTRKMMIGFCDSDLDTTKPVSFTEIHYIILKGISMFSILSGETQLGRKIGARFNCAEPYHLVLGFSIHDDR